MSETRVVGVAGAALALMLFASVARPVHSQARDGEQIFNTACATCHNGDDPRAPSPEALRGRSPQAVVDALTVGAMRYQGLALTGAERRAVAEYITGRRVRGFVAATGGRCTAIPPFTDPSKLPQWNGWGGSLENTHFQPASQSGLTADQVSRLSLKWAFGFPDASSAWAQPTVVGGRVFVGSQNAMVYALDAKSGCTIWTFAAHAGVRTAITIGSRIGTARAAVYPAYFSDQQGYAYAVDASNGKLIWSRKVDEHPLVRLTGAPVVYGGRVFVPTSSYEEGGKPPHYGCCTFRGAVVALDARTGDVVWTAHTIPEPAQLLRTYADGTELWGPAGAAIWSAPTVDVKRKALYVATGNTYSGPAQPTADAVLAFDLTTGALRWSRQMAPGPRDVFGCTPGDTNCVERQGPDFDFGASPVLTHLANGRDLIVAGQKSGVVYALDPDKEGAEVWHYRAGGGSGLGGIEWGIAVDREQAYAPVAELYNPTPGGLHAITLATGKQAWHAPAPPPVCGKPSRACSGAQFSAVTAMPGVVFSPSNDGAIRAYSTKDGSVIWTYDTNREFTTVNKVRAKGGSMNGPAPTIVGGMLYVNSGYGAFGLRPGNVLLAFAPP